MIYFSAEYGRTQFIIKEKIMKLIISLASCLMLGAVLLTGCSGSTKSFAQTGSQVQYECDRQRKFRSSQPSSGL